MDELLLRKAQRGDPEAFGRLMEPLEQLVWRVCWHYTGDRDTAGTALLKAGSTGSPPTAVWTGCGRKRGTGAFR